MKDSHSPGAAGGNFLRDLSASLVVFLVALPLCLGIAIACGVPPALGLVTGIVGGLVAGSLSGCRLQVSGPAAGLTVLVFDLVQKHGLAALGVVVLAAGLLQVLAGTLKVGRWFRAVSPAVVHGMLAGIGVLIVASQFHVMLDMTPRGSGLPNLLAIPRSLYDTLMGTAGGGHLWALALGACTLVILVGWKRLGLDAKTRIPGALPAVLVPAIMAVVADLPVSRVSVPDNIVDAFTAPSFSLLIEAPILLAALSMAFIASAETLLSAAAVGSMHSGPTTNYNRELVSQGVGNIICGLVGALPMTGVIARSTVNVQAGARTRLSGVLHGLWLLLMVVAIPFVLKLLPTATLAALLVYTGFKLVDLQVARKIRQYGTFELGIYVGTVAMVVATDLLTGVLVGLLLCLSRLVLKLARLEVKIVPGLAAGEYVLALEGAVTFLGVPRLSEAMESVPSGATVRVDFRALSYIDHACLDLLERWDERQKSTGGKLDVDWTGLRARSA